MNRITGELLYVSDYNNFSSVESEQKGNYLALAIDSDADDAEIDVELSKKVRLDKDKQIVLRITEATKKKPLKVTITANGKTENLSYDISSLKLGIESDE